jgi:GT2 family glycosyltransferase
MRDSRVALERNFALNYMDISVIICTHNRSHDLKAVMNSLEQLIIPKGLKWEAVIVDNNSNDDTKSLVHDFVQKGTLPVRYMCERRQGKSYALNTGIEDARGEILAFTDDDCITDPQWIMSILEEFTSDASLSGIGGRVELYDKGDKPVTIRTNRERKLFSSLDQLFSLIPGCNMAFTRRVFDVVGGFDTNLGPGTKLRLIAEDSDFLYRVFKKGFKVVYSPDILVYHNHGRKTDAQVLALNVGYVRGRGAFYCKHILLGQGDILKMAAWESWSLIKDIIRNFFSSTTLEKQRSFLCALIIGATCELIAKLRLKIP